MSIYNSSSYYSLSFYICCIRNRVLTGPNALKKAKTIFHVPTDQDDSQDDDDDDDDDDEVDDLEDEFEPNGTRKMNQRRVAWSNVESNDDDGGKRLSAGR